MNMFRRSRIAVGLATAVLAVAALATPPAAIAQYDERGLELNPTTGAIQHGTRFLTGNGFEFALPAVSANASAAGATNVFTIPVGPYIPAYYVGGLPQKASNAVLQFHALSVEVEYITNTGATTAASISLGSTATTATSILASTTLNAAPVAGTYQRFTLPGGTVLKTGDTITFTVGTAANGALAVKVHVLGYYQ